MINWIRDLLDPAVFGGARRSSGWWAIRQEYARTHPVCEATGSKKNLQVHHIKDFSNHPELELDSNNLIMLTRWIHFWLAHLGSWRSINPDIVKDAEILLMKIKNRR